jgi:hypothetical protein
MDTINAQSSAINATVLSALGFLFDMMSPPILELSWPEMLDHSPRRVRLFLGL